MKSTYTNTYNHFVTELNIERNPYNGGFCCKFRHNGKEYFADLCLVPYSDYTECMVFDLKGEDQLTVGNSRELYCKRDIPVTEEQLTKCVEEFIRSLQ